MRTINTTYYPAGHSMDSQWFAVDKDGNVGFFDTDEEGPLPIMVDRQKNWYEFLFEHSIPIEGKLHKLILPNDTIHKIISKCSTDVIGQMIGDYQTNEPTFFEGFILLNDGFSWDDLGFQKAIDNTRENFALKVSNDMELYYVDDVHYYKKLFIEAINKGIIKAAVFTDLIDTDEDRNVNDFNIDIFGGFRFESNDGWAHEPYQLDFAPEKPLNINAFAENTKNKVPVFQNISFANDVKGHLQALEHLSCDTYCRDDRTPVELLKKGYNKVLASDNKTEIYCQMSSIEHLLDLTGIIDCSICNNNEISSHNHCIPSAKTDFPPIIVLKKAEDKATCEKESLIRNQLLSILNINDNDIYTTCCVKCLDDEFNNLELENRFSNCHTKLEIECQYLQPLMIIGIGEKVLTLLQTCYTGVHQNANCKSLYEIKIGKNVFPYLEIDKNINLFSKVELEQFKTVIAGALSKKREIKIKPRVVGL